MPDTKPVRRRNLPLALLGLAPALLLAACNTQENPELTAAIARANEAAQRAETAQHAAEAASARARSDKLAVAHDEAVPVEDPQTDQNSQTNPGQPLDNQPADDNPG